MTGRVLLVEDDDSLRMTLERQVRSLGYQVTVAESGDAALKLFESGLVVVMHDMLNMPKP